MPVIGRDRELAVLNQALKAVVVEPVYCVIHGSAGIGKTTVWNEALASAESLGYRVLVCRPTQSEALLAFVGLGDLFDRVADPVLAELSPPLRTALEVALLRSDVEEPAPGSRLIMVALLEAVRALARMSPVILAIDDVQWLDAATAAAVEHVVARLRDERVMVLAALRGEPGYPLPIGVPGDRTVRIGLTGLSLGALHQLMRTRVGLTVSRPVLHQIEQVSGGNPFYALQIAQVLMQSQRALRPDEPLPVPDCLGELTASSVRQLPATARTALAAVAMLIQPTVGLIRAAMPITGLEALASAEDAGVITVQDERIRFTHPLLASAAFSGVSSIRRQSLHAQLSNVVGDVEQKAWHLALAGTNRDANVADTLEKAASRAQGRGGYGSAARLWELAALRTPETLATQQLLRTAAAGTALFHAGDAARAGDLLRVATDGLPAGRERARVLLDLADITFHETSTRQAAEMCIQALAQTGDDRELKIAAGLRAAWYHTHDAVAQLRSVEAAEGLLRDEDAKADPELYACVTLMAAYHRFYNGQGIDRASLDRTRALVRPDSLSWKADWARMIWRAFTKMIDLAEASAAYEAEYELFSLTGDEASMATLLTHMSEVDCWWGNWPRARDRAEAALELLEQCGQRRWRGFALYAKGLVDAHMGSLDVARAAAGVGLGLATDAADPWVSALHLGLLGFIELSAGNVRDADKYLTRAAATTAKMGLAEPGRHRFHADQFEAAVALGELDHAARLLDQLEQRVTAARYPWLLAITARCEGLLLTAQGDFDGAAAALQRALHDNEQLAMPFERARTLLAQGRLMRRRKEKLASRAALRAAQQSFDELDAPLWSAQAAEELRRLGLARGTVGELTPTEESIARLVATGLTNREVAAVACVSTKTVEANLSRVYRKLGVQSRRELSKLNLDRQL